MIKQAFRQFQYPTVPLHMADKWLAGEYHRAIDALDADMTGPGGEQ